MRSHALIICAPELVSLELHANSIILNRILLFLLPDHLNMDLRLHMVCLTEVDFLHGRYPKRHTCLFHLIQEVSTPTCQLFILPLKAWFLHRNGTLTWLVRLTCSDCLLYCDFLMFIYALALPLDIMVSAFIQVCYRHFSSLKL